MSSKKDGGTAFPMQDAQAIHAYAIAEVADITDAEEHERLYTKARAKAISGMSLRDYFAGQALAGLAGRKFHKGDAGEGYTQWAASMAYEFADELIKAREL